MSEPMDDPQEITANFAPEPELSDDGSLTVDLDDAEPGRDAADQEQFTQNLATVISQSTLASVAADLIDRIEDDKDAREDRDKKYAEGLKRTGMGNDAPGGANFDGASRVVASPILKGALDFAAGAMRELFPPDGPCRQKIVSDATPQRQEKAERLERFANWQTTRQIPEFRDELERLMSQLPFGGSQFFKLWWDATKKRITCGFIPIDDIILPASANSFFGSERVTHRQLIRHSTYQARVKAGVYVDSNLPPPLVPDPTAAAAATAKIEGVTDTGENLDELREIYEVYCWETFEEDTLAGGECAPYILTLDVTSRQVLSVYRNWDEEGREVSGGAFDPLHWIVEFVFVPWRGAYGAGLPHLIGSVDGAHTGAVRALLDSAHVNNVPTLITYKGIEMVGQTKSLGPTQVNQLDIQRPDLIGQGGAPSIRDLMIAPPFNPPSDVLFQLIGYLSQQAGSVISSTDDKIAEAPANAPVGTVQALIEQGARVKSAIHARLHNSMQRVLEILFRLNRAYLNDREVVAELGDLIVSRADFDGPMDVVPVSDPNIFSETQRIAQVQSVMALQQQAPQLYNIRALHERALKTMRVPNIDELLLPEPPEPTPMSPSSEIVALMMGQPVKVMPEQPHELYIPLLMQALSDQNTGISPLFSPSFVPAAMDVLGQRIAMLLHSMVARIASQMMGRHDPQMGEPDPDQVTQIDAEATQIAMRQIAQLVGSVPEVVAQAAQAVEQAKAMMQPILAPPVQPGADGGADALAQAEMAVGMAETQRKAADDANDTETARQRIELERMKLQADHEIRSRELAIREAELGIKASDAAAKRQQQFAIPTIPLGAPING